MREPITRWEVQALQSEKGAIFLIIESRTGGAREVLRTYVDEDSFHSLKSKICSAYKHAIDCRESITIRDGEAQ